MIIADDLISRIRGEYREMPGMRLTFAQACRLWQMDTTTCNTVLGVLLAEGFLRECSDGTYTAFYSDATSEAFPARRPTPAKARLPEGLSEEGAATHRMTLPQRVAAAHYPQPRSRRSAAE